MRGPRRSYDAALARASVVRYVAHYLAIIRPAGMEPDRLAAIDAALGRSTGWYFDVNRHDDPALAGLVPEEWITNYAVVGTPGEVVEQLGHIADLGFMSASLNLAAVMRGDMTTGLRETIDGFASVMATVRRFKALLTGENLYMAQNRSWLGEAVGEQSEKHWRGARRRRSLGRRTRRRRKRRRRRRRRRRRPRTSTTSPSSRRSSLTRAWRRRRHGGSRR